jgi:hypothetical protein
VKHKCYEKIKKGISNRDPLFITQIGIAVD